MSYYDYVYKEIGLLNPVAMAVMGALIVIFVLILLLTANNDDNRVRNAGDKWCTMKSLIKQNYVGKYSKSYLGIMWNFLTPVLLAIIICYVFMSIKDLYPDRNYGVYICAGFFVATACRHALTGRAFSGNSQIVRKTAAPGWVMALADTLSQFVILTIALVTTLIIRAALGDPFAPGPVAYTLILMVILFVFCFGCSLLFSTLSVLWDDIGQIISLVARVIVWVTPVFFYISSAKSALETGCMWNPFTYFIEPFHQTISYGVMPDTMMVLSSLLIALLSLSAGLLIYRHYFDRVREQI